MIHRDASRLEAALSQSRLRRALFVYEMAKSKPATKSTTIRRLANDVIRAARAVGDLEELT